MGGSERNIRKVPVQRIHDVNREKEVLGRERGLGRGGKCEKTGHFPHGSMHALPVKGWGYGSFR